MMCHKDGVGCGGAGQREACGHLVDLPPWLPCVNRLLRVRAEPGAPLSCGGSRAGGEQLEGCKGLDWATRGCSPSSGWLQ